MFLKKIYNYIFLLVFSQKKNTFKEIIWTSKFTLYTNFDNLRKLVLENILYKKSDWL